MSSKQLRSRIIPVAAVLALLSSYLPVFAQGGGFSIKPIVKRGDPVGDGGRFFDCDDCEGRVVGLRALNNRQDVAIAAHVVSGTCVSNRFLIASGQVIRLADFCHPTEFGDLTLLGPVNVNDRGEAVTLAGITVNNRIVAMLLKHSEGKLTKIVQEGDVSPIGTIFRGCGFGEPAINNTGNVAFFACGETLEGVFFGDGFFKNSQGTTTKVVVSGDPSPVGGEFSLNFAPALSARMNEAGHILFQSGVIIDPTQPERFGLFLTGSDSITKIEMDGDLMPAGGIVTPRTMGFGDLNSRGDVVFAVGLTGTDADTGIFLHSDGQKRKIMLEGEPTPVGGRFASLTDPTFTPPRINNQSTVAFSARVTDGGSPFGIFLGSPRAIVKVVAIGDVLPTGETIREINSFALNDLGEVAFFAYRKRGPLNPLGVFLASPLSPPLPA